MFKKSVVCSLFDGFEIEDGEKCYCDVHLCAHLNIIDIGWKNSHFIISRLKPEHFVIIKGSNLKMMEISIDEISLKYFPKTCYSWLINKYLTDYLSTYSTTTVLIIVYLVRSAVDSIHSFSLALNAIFFYLLSILQFHSRSRHALWKLDTDGAWTIKRSQH